MSPPFVFPAAVPELTGHGLHLRGLTADDIAGWYARATDPESASLAGDPVPASIEAGHDWLRRHHDRFRDQAAIRWAIRPEGLAESVGTVGLDMMSRDRRSAELGIVLGRGHWGRGIGSAAVRLVTEHAIGVLGIIEIQAETLERNLPSRRMLERTGFRLVGILRGGSDQGDETEACCRYILDGRCILPGGIGRVRA